MLDDKPFTYKGDPILDFTIANFLDRLAYKDPKSLKKLEKFKSTQRMANTEKPINEYDFKKGERPEEEREEEKFMYKYLTLRDKKTAPEIITAENADGEVISDVEMEEFAQDEIEKEMKRLTSGAGPNEIDIDDKDEEDDVSYSDNSD